MRKIAARGSIRGLKEIPKHVQELFATAHDIMPEWHIRMQAAFQKFTDNAVSKTVNLPQSASVGDVRDIYRKAIELKLKGITVYRYGSRADQPLTFVSGQMPRSADTVVDSEYSGDCRTCTL